MNISHANISAKRNSPKITVEFPDNIRKFAFFRYKNVSGDSYENSQYGILAWNESLSSLANLAEDENWGEPTNEVEYPILNNYLRNTYRRLVIEEKIGISENDNYAAFNTGLLNIYSEEIFGLFERNNQEDAQEWYFLDWVTESNRKFIEYFPEPPEMTEYVTQASDLVYDWRRELKLAFQHIIDDNSERFPEDLANNPRRAQQALQNAVEWAIRRARRNYKTIVPQWYPTLRENGAQFLMPLDLNGNGEADLALVISAIGDHAYRGNTVLTLEMAYSNARLIARPDSDWLVPSVSSEGLED